jgi:hypothetical protein
MSDSKPPKAFRRLANWLGDSTKIIGAVIAIGGIYTGFNVWVHGLVTKANMKATVEEAVTAGVEKAMSKCAADVQVLQEQMHGLPERVAGIDTTVNGPGVAAHELRIVVLEKTAERHDKALDSFMYRDRRLVQRP